MAPEDDDLDDELEDDEDYDDDERAAPQTEVTIEVTGLSLYTHHGVSAAEREVGQRLVLDLRLEEIAALGFPVILGTSRKSFLGRLTGRADPHERAVATAATSVLGLERGASIFRVHDVAATRDALLVAAATLRAHGA